MRGVFFHPPVSGIHHPDGNTPFPYLLFFLMGTCQIEFTNELKLMCINTRVTLLTGHLFLGKFERPRISWRFTESSLRGVNPQNRPEKVPATEVTKKIGRCRQKAIHELPLCRSFEQSIHPEVLQEGNEFRGVDGIFAHPEEVGTAGTVGASEVRDLPV